MRGICKLWLLSSIALLAACSDDTKPPADLGPKPIEFKLPPDKGTTDGPVTVTCSTDTVGTPIKLGGIFTITSGGSASLEAANKEHLEQIKAEINKGCGLTGDKAKGLPVEIVWKDGQDNSTLTAGLTTDLIQTDKVVAVVGAGGSAPTGPSAAKSVELGIPYGVFFATGDDLTGCTKAELANAAVTKSTTPVYETGKCWDHKSLVVRTATLSTVWGRTAAKYSLETWPTIKKAAVIFRNDSFGKPINEQFKKAFEAAGGTVQASIGYATAAPKDTFKTHIKTLVAGDPELMVGVWRVGELKTFMEAYVELSVDTTWTKPANYDKIQFLNLGSVKTDYNSLSAAAVAVMNTRSKGLEPSWDEGSEGYKKWLAAYKDFNPAAKVVIHSQMRTYDALMIMALAIVKANSTDPAKMKAEFQNVANPPGEKIYPGEFKKARALLMEGKDIDYDGASGPIELADTGNVRTTWYLVWKVAADGKASNEKTYLSAD
jgi:ABC-type branched-subunit amino acid transport system substrate-binding protein